MIYFSGHYVPTCICGNSEWLSIKTVSCQLADKPQFTRQELVKYTTVYYTLYLLIGINFVDYKIYCLCCQYNIGGWFGAISNYQIKHFSNFNYCFSKTPHTLYSNL